MEKQLDATLAKPDFKMVSGENTKKQWPLVDTFAYHREEERISIPRRFDI